MAPASYTVIKEMRINKEKANKNKLALDYNVSKGSKNSTLIIH